MTLTEEQARDLYFEYWGGENNELEHIEELDMDDCGKFHSGGCIFKETATGKHYFLEVDRDGDHWKGYDHSFNLECQEVEKVEVMSHEWRPVNGKPV